MNLKTRPLLVAAGAGVGIHLVVTWLVPQLLLTALQRNLVARSAVQLTWTLWLVNCLCGGLIDLALGALYAFLASCGEPLAGVDAAVGGSATVVLARLVSGGLGLCVGVIVTPLLIQAQGRGISGNVMLQVLPLQILNSLVTLLVAVLLGVVLGAIGGAVAAAIRGRGSTQPAGGGLL